MAISTSSQSFFQSSYATESVTNQNFRRASRHTAPRMDDLPKLEIVLVDRPHSLILAWISIALASKEQRLLSHHVRSGAAAVADAFKRAFCALKPSDADPHPLRRIARKSDAIRFAWSGTNRSRFAGRGARRLALRQRKKRRQPSRKSPRGIQTWLSRQGRRRRARDRTRRPERER